MANSVILNKGDKLVGEFDKALFTVLKRLDRNILDVVSEARTGNTYDAALILNSRPAMIQALRESGYNQLVEDYISEYQSVPAIVADSFKGRKLPAPKYSTADVQTFQTIARADLEGFTNIGLKSVDDLRLLLYSNAVSNLPFSVLVNDIKAATVGIDKKGSPLRNYAYTHANTAVLNFSGEVLIAAGESIGAEKWEVVGPNDDSTRDVCKEALANPIRTMAEWREAGYTGGTPGGWNCRHQLFPVLDD